MRARVCLFASVGVRACVHACMRVCARARVRACACARVRVCACARVRACARARVTSVGGWVGGCRWAGGRVGGRAGGRVGTRARQHEQHLRAVGFLLLSVISTTFNRTVCLACVFQHHFQSNYVCLGCVSAPFSIELWSLFTLFNRMCQSRYTMPVDDTGEPDGGRHAAVCGGG